ncbi:MAG: CoA-binding protein [Bacteroidetes bacterium]|nr:CoA-binding protein [Bacteroidota bacterium]
MINSSIFTPKSIVIVGASKDPSKIGGRILHNIMHNNFTGQLYGINPKETSIHSIPCPRLESLPNCDLAILCVPAEFTEFYVSELAEKHGVKGFIILSAGFSEMG